MLKLICQCTGRHWYNTPNSSAALDISSSNKGMLIPRLTTAQRVAITNPATGLLVFDTDKGSIMFYDGSSWRDLSFADEGKTDPQSRSTTQPLQMQVSVQGSRYPVIMPFSVLPGTVQLA